MPCPLVGRAWENPITMFRNRGNKATRDKDSILANVKNMLRVLIPAVQAMPKIERMEGAPHEMKLACCNIIRYFSIAKEAPEVRLENIHKMIGEFGVLLANFELCIVSGLMTEKVSLSIAEQMERIEEGIKKWRNAVRSTKSQDYREVDTESDSSND